MKFKKVYIEITNICNKNCSFCSDSSLPKKEMTLKEIDYVFGEVKKITNYIHLHIKGEPLLHSSFEEVLGLAAKHELLVNLTTNGSLLDKHLSFISNSKIVRQLNVSMQSVDDIEIDNIINLVNHILGINEIINIVYRFWANGNEKNLIKVANCYQCSEINLDNIKLRERLYLNTHALFIWPSLTNNIIDDKGFCYGLKKHIGILSNGTVIPCCLDCDGIINLGNIFSEGIENILESERVKKMIKSFQNNKKIEDLCQRCHNSVMME